MREVISEDSCQQEAEGKRACHHKLAVGTHFGKRIDLIYPIYLQPKIIFTSSDASVSIK